MNEHKLIEEEALGGSCSPAPGSAKPCAQNCPKCGATDISREHRAHGKSVGRRDLDDLCNDKRPYLIGDWPHGYISGKEHIGHHCRTCGYEWQTDVLPDDEVSDSPGSAAPIRRESNE